MALQCIATRIPEVMVISPDVFRDPRGFFMETYHRRKYEDSGVATEFVQDNYSHSCRDTLRGLHFQVEHPQQKLVSVIWGTIFDIAVDIRRSSPNFGKWVGFEISAANKTACYIPPGFAHGFCVLTDTAEFKPAATPPFWLTGRRGTGQEPMGFVQLGERDAGILWRIGY